MLPNASSIALCKEEIHYIFNTTEPGRESLQIQVENECSKGLLFGHSQFHWIGQKGYLGISSSHSGLKCAFRDKVDLSGFVDAKFWVLFDSL